MNALTDTPFLSGLPPQLSPALLEGLTQLAAHGPEAETATATAPYTGEPLAAFPIAMPDAVSAAFADARAAQRSWAATPVADRARILLRFHDLLLERQDEILDLMQAENGKTRRDAFLEVADIAITARYYARSAGRQLRPRRRRGAIPVLTRTTELRHPKGVVTVISPWNYPLSMAAGDALPALMAGNTVVQKPDTQTALSALWALKLMREAGLPKDAWQMVVGSGRQIGDTLLGEADYVMFTGSTASGRKIAAQAGEHLIGTSLELGGKNPMVVLEDADMERTAEGAISASFASAGQLCVSIERIYVPEAHFDDFVSRFAAKTRDLVLGTAYDYSVDVGSLTNHKQLETVTDHIQDAAAKGATVHAGGRARPDIGPLFHEPTVLAGVTADMTVHSDETFGPVVSIYPYRDVEEAIRLANDTPYGLNASVWGHRSAREVAARIHAGTVNINDGFTAAWGSIDAPMGGMGDSGLGRRHGEHGILKYTEPQSIAEQRLRGLTLPRSTVARAWSRGMTNALKLLRATGIR
ncbi:succinate-semialdehyde dehydrogenase/glutarate-semialdehyde dehydrogenase [Prauserella sediminis]|uniref:succinate-semialdehyde dehydrogenase (NADP(+)) n=1 Tax=Prauserella sediminis TaxID=577680 RepID=A0A839XZW4_9PSEU|nr:succinic semialdehyde dehydrogenase [Prauserella sediminis]MBB3665255.1 succinate-semialdehyde dehydrogenase/glutarate-semialdehyde dehydrogenase [Prauserella sediminis]